MIDASDVPPQHHKGSRFLTTEEVVARYSGKITVRSLRRWRRRGTGPTYFRIGLKILYPIRELKRWEAHRGWVFREPKAKP